MTLLKQCHVNPIPEEVAGYPLDSSTHGESLTLGSEPGLCDDHPGELQRLQPDQVSDVQVTPL